MSEICEHPFCTRLISKKCSTHCQLDLCQEHLIEHKNLFLAQYEKSFNNLKKSVNELINSIKGTKQNLNMNYEKQISLINENYKNKLNEIEQKSLLILSTENLIKKKSQLLNDVKNNQALLYQYDIEQIKLYLTKIREYHQDKIITEIETFSSSSDLDDDSHQLNTNRKPNHIMRFHGQCPLTRLGIYGLNDNHNIRLCSPKYDKSECLLVSHFHNYHHMKWSLSYNLTKAIMNKLNPLTTCIFQSELDIIDKRYTVIKCPLTEMKLSNCKNEFFQDSLRQHLLNVHHLTLETSNKIIETIQNKGHLMAHDFDEDEFD